MSSGVCAHLTLVYVQEGTGAHQWTKIAAILFFELQNAVNFVYPNQLSMKI
jgi:hypothetical protein